MEVLPFGVVVVFEFLERQQLVAVDVVIRHVRDEAAGVGELAEVLLRVLRFERGSLRLLWELQGGKPQSFRALRESADGMSPSVLNDRLKELREAGVVELAEGGYTLTPAGQALTRHLKPLNRWAEDWAGRAGG